jgi:hypothetical protein
MKDDPNLPLPVTPRQLIRLLEEMGIPGLTRKIKRYGQMKCTVTVDDIETAALIFSHRLLPSALDPDVMPTKRIPCRQKR